MAKSFPLITHRKTIQSLPEDISFPIQEHFKNRFETQKYQLRRRKTKNLLMERRINDGRV